MQWIIKINDSGSVFTHKWRVHIAYRSELHAYGIFAYGVIIIIAYLLLGDGKVDLKWWTKQNQIKYVWYTRSVQIGMSL